MNLNALKLSQLPSHGKLFVGIVTTLMLCVVLWAAWIYTVEKGEVDSEHLPGYLSEEQKAEIRDAQPSADHDEQARDRLRHNLGLAHVHINGQTLLFFALGVVFLFTSASIKVKRNLFILFGISILAHAVGLSGEGYYALFDDLLAISGLVILVIMLYMIFLIYMDLGRSRRKDVS